MQVILYNFFEESADVNLWRHLVDDDRDHHKVWDLKYAPLIYEVSDGVRFQVSDARNEFLSPIAQIFVCCHHPSKA
jgi:hypothetical protein